jgi:hypothetical protein
MAQTLTATYFIFKPTESQNFGTKGPLRTVLEYQKLTQTYNNANIGQDLVRNLSEKAP